MHDLDGAGSGFGCTQMHHETLDSQVARGLLHFMNPKFKEKGSSGRRYARNARAPNVDWKADRLQDLRLLPGQLRSTRESLASTTR